MTLRSLLQELLSSIAAMGTFESERAYHEECKSRPQLSDEEFIAAYYAESQIPPEIPLRLRELYAEQFAFHKVIPTDNIYEILQDIDVTLVMDEVADVFGIRVSRRELEALNGGDFDSIVRFLCAKLESRK